jgi:putative intracellular protease/amidase
MPKLKLQVEMVQVESFPTSPEVQALLREMDHAKPTFTVCGSTCVISCCHTE